jgi:hypothetical protein
VSTAVCTVRRMLDHLGLEPVLPNAGALLSPDHLATSLPPGGLEPIS